MTKAEEEFIKQLSYTNDRRFVILKCAEELNELSTILIQSVTKVQNENVNHISEEIADVEIQLLALKTLYGITNNRLNELHSNKIAKLISYKSKLVNFGQI